jgi:hypothetical protein
MRAISKTYRFVRAFVFLWFVSDQQVVWVVAVWIGGVLRADGAALSGSMASTLPMGGQALK